MINYLDEAIIDILDQININMSVDDFETMLTEAGFMIVPIEDPTNLRYGVED